MQPCYQICSLAQLDFYFYSPVNSQILNAYQNLIPTIFKVMVEIPKYEIFQYIWYVSSILIHSSQFIFVLGALLGCERIEYQLTCLISFELDIYNKVLGIIVKSHLCLCCFNALQSIVAIPIRFLENNGHFLSSLNNVL